MEFQKRLEKAIERGHRTSDARARAEAEKALGEEELRRMHTAFRLELNEHIEKCLNELPRHFPGFRFETVVSDRAWGAAASRDDLVLEAGQRRSQYSRLELLVRPFSSSHVLELTGKGTIRNKEYFNRSQFQRLVEVDLDSFKEMVDLWTLEYAELYASKS